MHDLLLLIAFLLFCVAAFISFTQDAWVWVLGFAGLALFVLGVAIPLDVAIG
jgi:hypothetical protein